MRKNRMRVLLVGIEMFIKFCIQYIFEVICLIFLAIIVVVSIKYGLIGVIFSCCFALATFFLLSTLMRGYVLLHKPQNYVLYLAKDKLHMNLVNTSSHERKDQFMSDFDKIINYCQENGKKKIASKTHRIVIYKLLDTYALEDRRNEFKSLHVGGKLDVKTSFGKIHIVRTKDEVNVLARYEYAIKDLYRKLFRNIKKTMKKIEFYSLEFYIEKREKL